MIYLENERLSVKVKEAGAELCSIFDKTDQVEHIWQADPTFWPWHAPILFPIIGVSENDELRIGPLKYPMPKHGFARKTEFTLLSNSTDSCQLEIRYDEATLAIYPYKFKFIVSYKLTDNQLTCTYTVNNEDNQVIYFSIGAHPAIALAYGADEQIEDYYIEFEHAEYLSRHHINKADGMFTGESSLILDNTNKIPIRTDMFERDAFIFKDHVSRSLQIKSTKSTKVIKVDFADFNYLGIWAIPGAKYVCIEPWLGCADTKNQFIAFEKKEGIITLDPKKSFACTFSIQII